MFLSIVVIFYEEPNIVGFTFLSVGVYCNLLRTVGYCPQRQLISDHLDSFEAYC